MNDRPFMVAAGKYDLPRMLEEWQWLLPKEHTPLLVSVFGDWVFKAPDGSFWCLSILRGDYSKIAADTDEYKRLRQSEQWMDKTFMAGLQAPAATRRYLHPTEAQCLGWKLHPRVGGEVRPENLEVFDMASYQSLMSQLHRVLEQRSTTPQPKKPWFKFW